MKLDLTNLKKITQEQGKLFWSKFERELAQDSGEAAKQHLAMGHPVHYGDDRFPEGIVKEYPSGKKQLVTMDEHDNEILIRDL